MGFQWKYDALHWIMVGSPLFLIFFQICLFFCFVLYFVFCFWYELRKKTNVYTMYSHSCPNECEYFNISAWNSQLGHIWSFYVLCLYIIKDASLVDLAFSRVLSLFIIWNYFLSPYSMCGETFSSFENEIMAV